MSSIHPIAVFVCESVPPFLTGVIVTEPSPPRQAGQTKAIHFVIRTLAATLLATVVAEVGKWAVIWSGHPHFPSGHMTFTTAAVTGLAFRRGVSLLPLALPLLALLAISLVAAGWHSWADVMGGLLLGGMVGAAAAGRARSPGVTVGSLTPPP